MADLTCGQQQQAGNCQQSWHANWPQHSTGWCHSMGGKRYGEQGRHVCQRKNLSTGRSLGAALGRGHTQPAAACSFLRRSMVLNRAAPAQLCMEMGLCDKSHLCCMLVVCIVWTVVTSQACICSHLQRGQGVCNTDVPC